MLIYHTHPPTTEFIDWITSPYVLPHTAQEWKATLKQLIMFSLIWLIPNIISSNLIASIMDDLQFLVPPNIFLSSSYPKSNKYERACLRFKKILSLIIFWLTGMCCLSQIWTLTYYIKLSLTQNFESFINIYLVLKKSLKTN